MTFIDRLCDRLASQPIFPALVMCAVLATVLFVGALERMPI